MADRNNSVNRGNTENPSTSQQNINNDTFEDANSIASSAGTLQMSLLENKLESEMANMSRTIKDTVTSLTEYMNTKLSEVDSKFNNLLADLVPTSRDSNVNSSVIQPPTEPAQNGLASGDPPIQCNSQQAIDRSQCKMKPQNFSGATDFDEFLSQFEITSEINGWQYREKSLYLASCLTGDARSLLSELDHDGRRDYNTLIEKLTNRFGSVNRSEIYRTQLKSRTRNKGESIPELAQAIKKLVRQAYPGVNKDVIETLSIDNFIDALGDSDIRLRVREIGPKTLADAERTALRLESHKIADRQRSRLVGQIESNSEKSNNAAQWESSSQFKILQSSIDSLSGQVEDLKKRNRLKEGSKMSLKAGKPQNNSHTGTNGKFNRPYRNNPPSSYNIQRHTGQFRVTNSHQNTNQNQSVPNYRGNTNGSVPRGRQTDGRYTVRDNNRNVPAQSDNNQGNWNRSGWRATTRRH